MPEKRLEDFRELVPLFATRGDFKVTNDRIDGLIPLISTLCIKSGADKEKVAEWIDVMMQSDPWPGLRKLAAEKIVKSMP